MRGNCRGDLFNRFRYRLEVTRTTERTAGRWEGNLSIAESGRWKREKKGQGGC